MKKITSILAILSLIFSPVTPAFAATYYWDTASTVDWETGWSFNPVSGGAGAGFPDVADMAVFNQSAVNGWTGPQLWGNYAVAGMTIKNTGTTLIDSNSAPTRGHP